jgi:hypothetical protein
MTSLRPSLKPLWWCYVGLCGLLQVLSLPFLAGGDGIDVAWFEVSMLSFVPMVGYIRQRAYGWRPLWATLLVIYVVALSMQVFSFLSIVSGHNLQQGWFALLAGALASAPGLWAWIAYAFFSSHVWGASTDMRA